MKEQDETYLGPRLPREDGTTAAIVYGCFVALLMFFLAAIAAIIFL